MRTRNILFTTTSLLLILLVATSFLLTEPMSVVSAQIKQNKLPTIIIDPGHGGEDGGATSDTNVLEKDLNLSIALNLKNFFEINGFDVIMTRETDTAIYDTDTTSGKKRSDLQNRVDIFNSSDDNLVLSIHQNKFTQSQYNGTQIFYSANNEKSALLAENIRNSVVSLIQQNNERQSKQAGSEIFILHNTTVPAVLIECGFLSNDIEAKLLQTEEYQSKLAYCIFLGVLEYYYINY